jgi:amino acid transporter
MLGRLVLLLLQIVIGWYGANYLKGLVHVPSTFELYVFAIICAIVVFLIGVIAAQVLKDVGTPSGHTLSWALTFALIAALLWSFGPSLPLLKEIPWGKVPALYAVLAGAIIGYTIKK